ncbi:serine/threonine-protein kinase [Polyangium aurulentum]|uniref:serine/threonine-protein kinase n=1 Tax=Polyangium aurulentum TaxID=2567896 RepID=UPI0010AE1B13|nr:serine/threonine-protein kinase [Polyangium aurulentum]UQA61563.1 serine/threonine protein kinase [Polyangium aurulentum]
MSAADAPLAESPTQATSLVGRRVGKYEIVRVLGRGGMGTVYEALNTSIGKRVAMKFVDASLSRNKDAVARFQREAQAASAVESAHIVEIFDAGATDDEQPYIVMELLRGEDLGHRIKRCGRLEVAEALPVIAQILRGLHRAHEAGIVHRDLKPDNIFLVERDDESDFVKILDFGISKVRRVGGVPEKTITRQGTVLGTPFYMSPEQAQAQPDVDGRTDLWSLGAILFECLTGRPPHEGHAYEQVIVNICTKDAPDVRLHNPGVPEPIARVIAKALTRDRDARYATAREMLDALGGASGGLVSARSLRAAGHGAAGSSPALESNTPIRVTPGSPGALEPTMEAGKTGPSRVGWSTSGNTSNGRDRRLVLVGAALAAIALAATGLVYVRREAPVAAAPAETAAPQLDVRAPEPPPAETATVTTPVVLPAETQSAPPPEPPPIATAAPSTSKKSSSKGTTKAALVTAPVKPTASPQPTGIAPQLKIKSE